jgi:GNAT superfamily N-acetyltransferase
MHSSSSCGLTAGSSQYLYSGIDPMKNEYPIEKMKSRKNPYAMELNASTPIQTNEAPNMAIEIFIANTDDEITACFPVFSALRPHKEKEDFLPQVKRQQSQNYQILALRENGAIKSVAGFRFCEFLAWGKVLYLDDLSTLPEDRSNGFAELLLDWLIDHAKTSGCKALHLDSGYNRNAAHRLYLRKGLKLSSHHLELVFN